MMGITPTINQPPPVLIARRDETPVTTTAAPMSPSIVTMTASMTDGGGLPDLRGLSARDALRELARLGLTARMEGAGVVVDQSPAPGTLLEPGGACSLVLNRRPPPRPTGVTGDQR